MTIVVLEGETQMQLPAGQFKAKCLKLMDEVQEHGEEIVITKFGKPVAKLIPFVDRARKKSHFGCMQGTATILGDVIKPIDVSWMANA